jgi:hypothetical protein
MIGSGFVFPLFNMYYPLSPSGLFAWFCLCLVISVSSPALKAFWCGSLYLPFKFGTRSYTGNNELWYNYIFFAHRFQLDLYLSSWCQILTIRWCIENKNLRSTLLIVNLECYVLQLTPEESAVLSQLWFQGIDGISILWR